MVKIMHRTLMTFCIALLGYLSMISNAHAATLWAVVNSNQVTQAEVFKLRIIFDEKVDAESINFKPLEEHFFLGQPSYASSLNFTNGKRTSTSEWTIALKAKSLGKVTIPAFEVEGSYSQPIDITVTADTDLPSQQDFVEIESRLSRSTLYPNESAELKTRLIIKADLRRLQNTNFFAPTAQSNNPGISIAEQGKAQQTTQVINGVEVTVFEQTFLVTAEKTGDYTLNSLGFSATVVLGSNRGGTTKLIPIEIIPETFNVVVKEKPQGLTNQWIPTKALTFKQRWLNASGQPIAEQSALNIKIGDSITRELTLVIDGLKPERFPTFDTLYPSALRQYAEKPQYSQLNDGNFKMTVKQVLIAQQSGTFTLPEIALEWWNTTDDHKAIDTLKGLSLTIEPSDSESVLPAVTPLNHSSVPPVVTYDRGYWPYLTTLFAILWLSTLAWHIKSKVMAPAPTMKSTHESNDMRPALLHAIAQQDTAKIHYLAKRLLTETNFRDSTLAAQINHELTAMNTHIYGGENLAWDSRPLLKLIKRLSKEPAPMSKDRSQLPKL